jgi:hypothetical protein
MATAAGKITSQPDNLERGVDDMPSTSQDTGASLGKLLRAGEITHGKRQRDYADPP